MGGNNAVLDWSKLSLKGDPQMLVGRRKPDGSFDARRISLHKSAYEPLLEVCEDACRRLASMSPVAYGPYTFPEFGEEYLLVQNADGLSDMESDLPGLCREIDSLAVADESELANLQVQFYGISYESNEGVVTFLRKSNPKRAMNRGTGGGVISW